MLSFLKALNQREVGLCFTKFPISSEIHILFYNIYIFPTILNNKIW